MSPNQFQYIMPPPTCTRGQPLYKGQCIYWSKSVLYSDRGGSTVHVHNNDTYYHIVYTPQVLMEIHSYRGGESVRRPLVTLTGDTDIN